LYKKFSIFVQKNENYTIMTTNIDIDQEKLSKLMLIKKFKSKKEAVNEAITEYLKDLNRKEVLKWRGANSWEGDLDEMRRD
jgi:Arc/MetJ family transcription regulator